MREHINYQYNFDITIFFSKIFIWISSYRYILVYRMLNRLNFRKFKSNTFILIKVIISILIIILTVLTESLIIKMYTLLKIDNKLTVTHVNNRIIFEKCT
ncbi:hypothetical protein RIR_e1742_A0A2N1M0T6_9GLOM [Rhizophagus irregularis DAOM 181602=DAOM 197198]|nr:hypothetical protein RIR_e1742_A0A2N1M0T6_9GLOM [Rhizophagus irregularis DAOM 181602=DAOM 197198]